MQTLKDLADEGRTVVCSIHQPRSSIFTLFDDLLLLSEGRMVYNGPAEGSLQHFAAQVCVAEAFPSVCILDCLPQTQIESWDDSMESMHTQRAQHACRGTRSPSTTTLQSSLRTSSR